MNREPATTPFSAIETRFELTGYHLWGKYHPAVTKKPDGTYRIRILVSRFVRGDDVTDKYDYFETTADGIITASPRGYTRTYNKTRLTGVEEALERYASPDGAR